MKKDVVLSVNKISKKYRIGEKQRNPTLRDKIAGLPEALVNKKKKRSRVDFWALKDVSFDLKRGEVLGIIGKNGSGKSTLLKILSRITTPTTGMAEIEGRVSSLLEVGTGFSLELSGRDNIYLNGSILGMTQKEIEERFDDIVAFSGIEKFLDTPVKRYSSGMYVRLAFAVAAHLNSEIMLIDEVLAVGDMEFQKKCLGKMEDVAKSGRTVLFVSHNMGAIRQLCTKGIVLTDGSASMVMPVEKSIKKYLSRLSLSTSAPKRIYSKDKSVCFKNLIINNQHPGEEINVFAGDAIEIKLDFTSKKYPYSLNISLGLRKKSDNNLVVHTTNYLANIKHQTSKAGRLKAVLYIPHLSPGIYTLEMEAWLNSKIILTTTAIGEINIVPIPFFASKETFTSFPSSVLIDSEWEFTHLKK